MWKKLWKCNKYDRVTISLGCLLFYTICYMLEMAMISSKFFHILSFGIGSLFLLLSIYLAFFVKGSAFYTSFALGSWLFLDFIDYKLTNTSILTYFYNHKHRKAFYFIFLMSFFACFTVDFIWGVQILKMWEWVGYTAIEFVRMYLIMNISFVLGMYELYRVVYALLKPHIPEKNLLNLRIPYNRREMFFVGLLCIGILFLVSPLYFLVFHAFYLTDYIEIFPFLSIACITDAITHFTGGQSVLEQIIRLNKLRISAIAMTVLAAFVATEGMNLFGREWKYLRMPFSSISIFSVPLAVLIGWIPLIVGLICLVNMAKHLDYITTRHTQIIT